MIIWDTTRNYNNYPEPTKNIYKKIYLKNINKYNSWIDSISKINKDNYNWWFSVCPSRNELDTNLYHYFCIIETLNYNSIIFKRVILSSFALKKKLNEKFPHIIFEVDNFSFNRLVLFLKNFFFFILKYIYINLFIFKKKYKNINIASTFVLSVNLKYNFYKKFFSKIMIKKIFYIPLFMNFSLKNFSLYVSQYYNKKNIIFTESFLTFGDILRSFFFTFKINKNFLLFGGNNFNEIIKEEIKKNRYNRSVIQSYLNFFFFKRLKENNIHVNKAVSTFENQIIDKGWQLGVNKYYSACSNYAYQPVSFHPQFQYLYPTNSERISSVLPDEIYVTGKFFLKERKKFCKKLIYKLSSDQKFLNIKKIKKNINILILLSGIKKFDIELIDVIKSNYLFFSKNRIVVYFKFHPILESSYIFNDIYKYKFFKEIHGSGSKVIQRSKIVITSSFTAGLYESLIRGCYTFLYDLHPLDYKLYKKFNDIDNFLFFRNPNRMIQILNLYINKKVTLKKRNNVRLKNIKELFFNQ
jgi:hypothetical protein